MSVEVGAPVPQNAVTALRRVAAIALMGIVLGFAVQVVILAIKLAGSPPSAGMIVDVAGGVTWSLLVCTGIGVGLTIAKGRPLLTGALAFCFAPASLAAAKASQKVMTGWLGAAEKEAVLSLGTISLLRACEYALLGWLLGWLVVKGRDTIWPYLGAGSVAGLSFGGAITLLTWRAAFHDGAPLTQSALAVTAINEVVFPVGCAVVIFLGQFVGRHLKVLDSAAA